MEERSDSVLEQPGYKDGSTGYRTIMAQHRVLKWAQKQENIERSAEPAFFDLLKSKRFS